MDTKLQTKIYKTYPRLFTNSRKSKEESCMFWGLCVGNGWYNLLDTLCSVIGNHEDNNKGLHVVVDQVKEKFGGLRFYYHIEGTLQRNNWIKTDADVKKTTECFGNLVSGAVWMADAMSYTICEVTGKPGSLRQDLGWIRSLCDREYEIALTNKTGIAARIHIRFLHARVIVRLLLAGRFKQLKRYIKKVPKI